MRSPDGGGMAASISLAILSTASRPLANSSPRSSATFFENSVRDRAPYTVVKMIPRMTRASRISISVKPRCRMSRLWFTAIADEIQQLTGVGNAFVEDDAQPHLADIGQIGFAHLALPRETGVVGELAVRGAGVRKLFDQLHLGDVLARQQHGPRQVLVAADQRQVAVVQAEQADEREGDDGERDHHLEQREAR